MNEYDDRIVAVCEHVLAGEEIFYISNCGGHWSFTCEKDIDYENDPSAIKFVHFGHVKNLNPDVRLVLSLPLNSCLCREGKQLIPDYEAYEDNSFKQAHDDFECAHPLKTTKILGADCYAIIKNSLVVTKKIEENLEVATFFTSREKAEKHCGDSGSLRIINNSDFNWVKENSPINVMFFILDPGKNFPKEVHLLNYRNCLEIQS